MVRNLQRLEETVDQLIRELVRTQSMTIGTLEVIKKFKGYEEAVKLLKEENENQSKKNS